MYIGWGPSGKAAGGPKGDNAAVGMNGPRARKRKSFLPVRHVAGAGTQRSQDLTYTSNNT